MNGLTPIAEELDQDAAVPFAQYLLNVYGQAIATEEDTQVLNSTSPFTGILDATGVNAVTNAGTSFSDVDHDTMVDLQYGINENLVMQGTFVFHPKVQRFVRKIKTTTNDPIWAPLASNQPATILGDPYRVTTAMPSTDGTGAKWAVYGDFSHCVIGIRSPFSVKFSEAAGFKEGLNWMKVSERIASVVATPDAFAYLANA